MKRTLPTTGPRLVALVGGSGAGKSWLADQLQKRLGKEAARLCLDDFYRDRSHLPLGERARLNFDHPRSIDWPAVERVLLRCKAGLPVQVPRYDFKSHTRIEGVARWKPKPVVLVEGLWLLRRRALRRLFSCRIFVQCPARLRLQRRIARDTMERGRQRASIRAQFFAQVAPMHKRYVAPQARWADLVVRSPLPARELDRLARQVRGLGRASSALEA